MSIIGIETSEAKSTVFVTRFESSSDGIKSTTSKIADVEGVLIEEVLSEPEQEKEAPQFDVTIEEVKDIDDGEISLPITISIYLFNRKFTAYFIYAIIAQHLKSAIYIK